MKVGQKWVRLGIALALAGWIAVQIPVSGAGVGLAADCYGCAPGNGSGGRRIIMTGNTLMVGYGIVSSMTTASAIPASAVALPTPVPPVAPPEEAKPIYDAARENEDLTGSADLADTAGMKERLRNEGPYTAFLPTNAALSQMDAARRAELIQPANRASLETLIRAHIVKGSYTIEQLKTEAARAGQDGLTLETLSGDKMRVTYDAKDGLRINGISVVETDILCSNGVIHPISTTIIPASRGENDERQ